MKKLDSKAFSAVEVLLIILVVGVIGGIGWYVMHRQSQNKINAISSFAECKADKDSKLQESYPEVCVTKNTKHFTGPDTRVCPQSTQSQLASDPTGYLTIKEWCVRGRFSGTQTLTYSFQGKDLSYAKFSSKELQNVDQSCKEGMHWNIVRAKTGQITGNAGSPIETHADAVRVGDYYYEFEGANIYCEDVSIAQMQIAGANETIRFVDTLELAPTK